MRLQALLHDSLKSFSLSKRWIREYHRGVLNLNKFDERPRGRRRIIRDRGEQSAGAMDMFMKDARSSAPLTGALARVMKRQKLEGDQRSVLSEIDLNDSDKKIDSSIVRVRRDSRKIAFNRRYRRVKAKDDTGFSFQRVIEGDDYSPHEANGDMSDDDVHDDDELSDNEFEDEESSFDELDGFDEDCGMEDDAMDSYDLGNYGDDNDGDYVNRRGDKGGLLRGISQSERAILFDHEYFEKVAREEVYEINHDENDPLEALFDEAFIASFKTRTGAYEVLIEHPRARHVQLHKPRSLLQLQYATLPRLSVDAKSPGYALGEKVWTQLWKNMYYKDSQKLEFADGVAKDYNKLWSDMSKAKYENVDRVMNLEFRKGLAYRKKEEAAKLKTVESVKKVKRAHIGETDWSVQAVEDEDSL